MKHVSKKQKVSFYHQSYTAFATELLFSLPKFTKYSSRFFRMYGKYFIAAWSRDDVSISFTVFSINMCVVLNRLIKVKSHGITQDMEHFTSVSVTRYNPQSSVTQTAKLSGEVPCYQSHWGRKGSRYILLPWFRPSWPTRLPYTVEAARQDVQLE